MCRFCAWRTYLEYRKAPDATIQELDRRYVETQNEYSHAFCHLQEIDKELEKIEKEAINYYYRRYMA